MARFHVEKPNIKMTAPALRKFPSVKADPNAEASGISEVDIEDLLSQDGHGNIPLAPEIVSPQLENLVQWDESADAKGYRIERVLPEDEASYAERFVEEGLDEAEEDLRALEEQQIALETKDEGTTG